MPHRFAIIGNGAISAELRRLAAEEPALELIGVVAPSGAVAGAQRLELSDAIAGAETVVEAAGIGAVREHGPAVIAAGRTLLLASVGALASAATRDALRSAGPGRIRLSSGAIGGLDLIAAAARSGGLDAVTLTTTKHPRSLVQPDTPAAERAALLGAETPSEVFSGTVAEAIARFPASLNVAVALDLAAGDVGLVRVRLIADPATSQTEHAIAASGPTGSYTITVRNEPLPAHPSSSGLTARALLSGLLTLAGVGPSFV